LFNHLYEVNTWKRGLSAASLEALESIGLDTLINHISTHIKNEKQATQQIELWFDAFKTLKFIHYLQNTKFPAMPLNSALKEAPFN